MEIFVRSIYLINTVTVNDGLEKYWIATGVSTQDLKLNRFTVGGIIRTEGL